MKHQHRTDDDPLFIDVTLDPKEPLIVLQIGLFTTVYLSEDQAATLQQELFRVLERLYARK